MKNHVIFRRYAAQNAVILMIIWSFKYLQCIKEATTIFFFGILYVYVYIEMWGGGYFHQKRTWMCLSDLENLTFSIPVFT